MHINELPPTSNDYPEPLLSDGLGGIIIPSLLYRAMFHKESCAGHIVRYSDGGYFANSADEIVEVDYDYLASVILSEPSEGFPAQPSLA